MNDASRPAADLPAPPASTGSHGRLRGFLSAQLDSKAYLGLHLTMGLAVAALGLWVFGALLDTVLDNATMVRRDIATDAAIHDLVTPTLVRIGLGATQLGSPPAMGALLVAGATALWIARRRTMLIGWVAAFVVGAAVGEVLKLAGLLILAVGLSRIFVGVHYPSGVLGGDAAGAVWMAVCITGVHIARHRQMDREHPASVAAGEQVQPTLP